MTVEQVETAWKIACIVFFAGIYWAELKAIRKDIKRLEIKQEQDIKRLEVKQDKYNHLQERTVKLEVWKEIHEREGHDK